LADWAILDDIDSEVEAGLIVLVSVQVEVQLVRHLIRFDLFVAGTSRVRREGARDFAKTRYRCEARGGMVDDVPSEMQIEVVAIVSGGGTWKTQLDTAAGTSVNGFVTPQSLSLLEELAVVPDGKLVGWEEPEGEGGGGGVLVRGIGVLQWRSS